MSNTADDDVRVLFVRSWTTQTPPRNGGDHRLLMLLRAADSCGQVDSVLPTSGEPVPHQWSGYAARWAWVWLPKYPGGHAVRERAHAFDVVFLHRMSAIWASGLSDLRRCVIDIDDIPSQICQQGLAFGPWWIRALKQLRFRWVRWAERRCLSRAGTVLVCSEDDARYLNLPNVAVVPNAFPTLQEGPGASTRPTSSDMLFVGELAYAPNERGLRWFITEVLPIIRTSRPETSLRVVGRVPSVIPDDWTWRFADGVEFLGPVDAIPPYLAATALSICPLQEGQGTRIKIMEALSQSRAVVATTIGAYGLPLREDDGLFRADDSAGFAQRCLELLENPVRRQQAADHGQRRAQAEFSPDAVCRRAREAILAVAAHNRTLRENAASYATKPLRSVTTECQ